MHGVGRVKIALFMKIAPDYPHKKYVLWIRVFFNDYIQYSGSYFLFFFLFFFPPSCSVISFRSELGSIIIIFQETTV